MARLLIAYSTTDGHTPRICRRLAAVVEAAGHDVTIEPIARCGAPALDGHDAVVVGASVRYGRHQREVGEFLARHRMALERKPNALFSVNVVARKPGKDDPDRNPYLRKLLRTMDWRPQHLAVFAGRIDYPRLGPVDRALIRFIMWMTRGPTDPKAVVEFTDWARVQAFGAELARMLPAR